MSERDENGRWLAGSSGNLRGRPKGTRSLTEDLYKILREPSSADELEAAYDALEVPPTMRAIIDLAGDRQEAFARLLAYRMLVGSWAATEQVFGRLDPIPARSEISGPGGGPIVTAGVQLAGAAPSDAQSVYTALVRGEEIPDASRASDGDGNDPAAG